MRTRLRQTVLLLCLFSLFFEPPSVRGTVGWETEDIILDFGVEVENDQREVLLSDQETGHPFDLELTWRLNPNNCLLLARTVHSSTGKQSEIAVADDKLFNGNPAHARLSGLSALYLQAEPGKACSIEAQHNEVIVMAKPGRTPTHHPTRNPLQGALGATVLVMRATSFFTPSTITVRAGEKVVWIYADGAHEPHSVTSGACADLACSGGGREFQSGPTLTQPGHRFEHVFTEPGTYPYHCRFHLGSMQGTVIVKP